MRFLSKTAMLCLSSFLLWAGSTVVDDAHAATPAEAPGMAAPCETNLAIEPSVHVCVGQRDVERDYQVDTDDGRHMQFSVAEGGIDVLPVGRETVRVAVSDTAVDAVGAPAVVVYQDSVVRIEQMRDSQDRLIWVVRPYALRNPLISQGSCKNSADCSGNQDL